MAYITPRSYVEIFVCLESRIRRIFLLPRLPGSSGSVKESTSGRCRISHEPSLCLQKQYVWCCYPFLRAFLYSAEPLPLCLCPSVRRYTPRVVSEALATIRGSSSMLKIRLGFRQLRPGGKFLSGLG